MRIFSDLEVMKTLFDIVGSHVYPQYPHKVNVVLCLHLDVNFPGYQQCPNPLLVDDWFSASTTQYIRDDRNP